ncbi:hypothetical protein A4U53_031070 [Rhizobium ruizarguesonis]
MGNEKVPKVSVFATSSVYGKMADRKEGKFKFAVPLPAGRYAIQMDTPIMEPALIFGSKAWVDPSVWPKVGNEVLVHARNGVAWIGRLESHDNDTAVISQYAFEDKITVRNVEAIHTIVLSERVTSK